MSIVVAFRAFFVALFNRQQAAAIAAILNDPAAAASLATATVPPPTDRSAAAPPPASAAPPANPPAAPAAVPARSDAITLLAMLQREARFVDLVQEPLDQYSDEQVGAAARPCLAQCRATLARVLDLQPLVPQAEGDSVTVPADASPLRYQWADGQTGTGETGTGQTQPSVTARLVHPGWRAGRCEIARWTGNDADAAVIAAAQVESAR